MKTDETSIYWAHNPKVVGSSPTSATRKPQEIEAFFFSTKPVIERNKKASQKARLKISFG